MIIQLRWETNMTDLSELRIRVGIWDNLKNFFLISQEKHVVTPH